MRAGAGVLVFAVGLAAGVGVSVLAPSFARPYLPVGLGGARRTIEAEVLRKQREGERLLLLLSTADGRMLAAFEQKASEVDLLVGQGDRLVLGLTSHSPFVDDPEILRVSGQTKASAGPGEAPGQTPGQTPGQRPDVRP